MKRLWFAMGAFAVLMLLTLITIDDQKIRLAALAILAMFAVRTWSHSRKLRNEEEERSHIVDGTDEQ
jgi:membrane protein implicated in regulation of membrane protease activity